jgi:hypothetical protein
VVARDPHIALALNRFLASPLRVEIDEVSMEPTSQVNLTALAHEIQRSVDALQDAVPERMVERHVWEEGGYRVAWHARTRRDDEAGAPVIVT